VNDVELNLKHRIGGKEDFAVRSVAHKDQTMDNTKKGINMMQRQKQKELNQLEKTPVVECLERNIVKKPKSKCQKVAKNLIITLMEDTMKKLKQTNVRFVENLKKEYSYITKIKTERIMKLTTLLLSATSVIVKYTSQMVNGVKTWRGD